MVSKSRKKQTEVLQIEEILNDCNIHNHKLLENMEKDEFYDFVLSQEGGTILEKMDTMIENLDLNERWLQDKVLDNYKLKLLLKKELKSHLIASS